MKLTKNKILILVPLLVLACGCLGQVTVDDIANSLGLTETESIPELPNYIYGYDNNGTLVSIDIISDTVWFKVSHRYPENTLPYSFPDGFVDSGPG